MTPSPTDLLQQIRDIADWAIAEAGKNDSPDFRREILRLEELVKELVAKTHPRTDTL